MSNVKRDVKQPGDADHVNMSTTARRLITEVGWRALVGVLLAPVLVAVVVALLTPRIVATQYQASARIELYPIVGDHATYNVTSVAADFIAAYTDVGEKAGIAATTGEPTPTLTAEHPSDSSVVFATYAATSPGSARRGLRIAVVAATAAVAQQEETRTGIMVTAARSSLSDVIATSPGIGSGASTAASKTANRARENVIQQTSQAYADALVADGAAHAVVKSVANRVASTPVTVEKLSNTSAEIRVVAVAGFSAFVVACIVIFVLRRRLPRGRAGSNQRLGSAR